MRHWKKLPPYAGTIHQGCLCCPPVEEIAPLDTVVAVGFGCAMVQCGSKVIFAEGPNDEVFRTLAEFEEMAQKDPDHSWLLILEAPLRGRTYQRQDVNKWVLVDSNMGFA